ncbi:MAG: putative transporter periplasmic solute-binding protein [Marmoricola sp.]|jgi:multiple sugar transport system substrate-binding protein|nr:putative transporter periplasmic solute-binding protein [Marmoricola sp.]
MPKPSTEADYLASMVPASAAATRVARRGFLKGALGAGALLSVPLLGACGGDDSSDTASSGGGGKPKGTVTFGSNEAGGDDPQKRRQALIAAYQKQSGLTVKANEVDHNTFQENINNYLQGKPDDVFAWFAGYRMRFFAQRGLIGDISDIYPVEGINDAFTKAATADDGKQYFVPDSNYPWAVFYRKSLWQERGYQPPKTLDEFTALAKQMQADKLAPLAFADKDGWPAMGTFDILNMRINGYDFHVDLMAGKEAWDSAKVKKVFDTWRGLLPYHQPDSLGRTWQEAAQSLQKNQAGMYFLGLFMYEQFPENERDDVDFFTFPEVDSTIGADAIDAPIDGYCMAKEPQNEAGAKDFLKFLCSPEAAAAANTAGYPLIWANSNASQEGLNALQKKAATFISEQKSIAQFLDRDTRPDFASTVMIPALQDFIKKPNDIDGLTSSLESQKKSIFV